jgi:hypothetical protein
MGTLFWYRKGNEKPQEYSKNVAGGGRSNVPSHSTILGISRVPTMQVERMDPDGIRAAPIRDICNGISTLQDILPRSTDKGPRLENFPNESKYVQEQRLKFI